MKLKKFLTESRYRVFTYKSIKFNVPSRFENISDEDLLKLPAEYISVENAGNMSRTEYKTLQNLLDIAVKNPYLAKQLTGAMTGSINGKLALRFESDEAALRLSA